LLAAERLTTTGDDKATDPRLLVLGNVEERNSGDGPAAGRAHRELYVAAEIHRRGGYAVTFAGNMPGIDILASDRDLVRRITIQVKTKAKGTWHAQGSRDGAPGSRLRDETSFWVFVDLEPVHPVYHVAPRWWVRNNIWEVHSAYLAQTPGLWTWSHNLCGLRVGF
jgi:hypothetical protein